MPYLFRWRKDRLTLLLWLCLFLLAMTASVLSLTAAFRHVRQQESPGASAQTELGMEPSFGAPTPGDFAARSDPPPDRLPPARATRHDGSAGPARLPPPTLGDL